MSFFQSLSEKAKTLASESVESVTSSIDTIKKGIATKEEMSDEEKTSQMLQVLDWAYNKANGNVPGFGTSQEMAEEYLKKNNGNIEEAVDAMVRWQVTAAATAGFVTSLGGLPTMLITLPANIAGVMAIQLRLIGAIAHMSGSHEETEERKTGMYLCLLGTEASNVLSKTAAQFAIKFTTATLKKLSGKVLTKINQAVGFRLVTKFGTKGLVNLHKAIPLIGGFVGGSVDALSTYTIAQTAKALFLGDMIDFERQETLELNRMRVLMNMALVDGIYGEDEKNLLLQIASSLTLSEKVQTQLYAEINTPKRQNVDLKLFKDDPMLSACLLGTLNDIISADGQIHPAEKIYFNTLAKDLGYDETTLNQLLGK